jgi:hypothetical protein
LSHLIKLFIGLCLISGLSGCGDGKVIATVDSEKITAEEFDRYSKRRAALFRVEELSPEERKDLLDLLIQNEEIGLDQTHKPLPSKDLEEASNV